MDTMDIGSTFDISPVPMWIEDYAAVRQQLDLWRAQGITDLRHWLLEDLSRASQCARLIKVVQVNDATLRLFEAQDQADLVANLGQVFRDDMLLNLVEELCQLWDGKSAFQSMAVNYTLSGKRLDIQLKAAAYPGHETDLGRMLIVTEDVTERETARRDERLSRLDAEGLFQHSPVSLWIEDFSRIHDMLAELRQLGISDLRVFTDVHPEFVRRCMQHIKVLDVNQSTLDMFVANNRKELLDRLGEVFRDEMEVHFREQLIDLWGGNLRHAREVINYALDGTERAIIMRFSVIPGHEHDWSRVLIALTDITARKKAEAYLAYLGKHDVLTGLSNRAHFIEQLNLYVRQGVRPLSVIILDMDGLKEANDVLGHAAGDSLLQRTGEILREAVAGTRADAARIGGDEFAILLPYATEAEAALTVEGLANLIAINNTYHGTRPLSLSIGSATLQPGETQDDMIRRADGAMYDAKRTRRQPR